jgi:hypothetical protein
MDETPPSELLDAEETGKALHTATAVIQALDGMDG